MSREQMPTPEMLEAGRKAYSRNMTLNHNLTEIWRGMSAAAPTVSGGEGWEELERLEKAVRRAIDQLWDKPVRSDVTLAKTALSEALIAVARGGGKEAEAETFPRRLVIKPERVDVFSALAQEALVPTEEPSPPVVDPILRKAMGEGIVSFHAGILADALRTLKEACERADAQEDLSFEIDGSMLDAANRALDAFDGVEQQAAISAGEQVGTSGASEPNPLPTVQAETAVVGISHLNAEQQADIRAHVAGLSDPESETYEAPEHGWSCFHCGQNFRTARGARLHFGQSPKGRTSCAEPERLLADYDDAIMNAYNASPVRVGYESKMARVAEARGSILRVLAPVSTGEQPGMSEPFGWAWKDKGQRRWAMGDRRPVDGFADEVRPLYDHAAPTLPADLLSLSEAATAGEWKIIETNTSVDYDGDERLSSWSDIGPSEDEVPVATVLGFNNPYWNDDQIDTNAALIVASVNFIRTQAAKQGGKS